MHFAARLVYTWPGHLTFFNDFWYATLNNAGSGPGYKASFAATIKT